MSEDRIPTGADKIAMIATQMTELVAGDRPSLDCPYCMGITMKGGDFCCQLMARAFAAILDAKEQIEVTKFMDRVMDRHLNN